MSGMVFGVRYNPSASAGSPNDVRYLYGDCAISQPPANPPWLAPAREMWLGAGEELGDGEFSSGVPWRQRGERQGGVNKRHRPQDWQSIVSYALDVHREERRLKDQARKHR